MPAPKVSFNYKVIKDPALRATAQANAKQIQHNLAKTGQFLVDTGTRLQKMREELGDSVFREWILTEFHWGLATASNYMRAALVFGGEKNLELFQPTAMVRLSRRNVPQEVIDKALAKARGGDVVTISWVSHALSKYSLPHQSNFGKPKAVAHVRAGEAPSIQEVRFILDQWTEELPKIVGKFSSDDFQEVENRLEELMAQLRAAQSPQEPPKSRGSRRALAMA